MGSYIAGAFIIACALALWLSPIYIAHSRHARNVAQVALVTVLLGWTLIGWIIAVFMALTPNTRHHTHDQPTDPTDTHDIRR